MAVIWGLACRLAAVRCLIRFEASRFQRETALAGSFVIGAWDSVCSGHRVFASAVTEVPASNVLGLTCCVDYALADNGQRTAGKS
ncbi:MAG: hypothetical protein CBB71_23365 [Rhodopirellula sp. TMED11]|nr:MAG: hypothetical protein CBB71_23365 [Rhodopirellula sp. TMED11]